MHFTHVPASDRGLRPAGYHHTWTDANIDSGTLVSRRLRKAYRTMRAAGLTPAEARAILWDAVAAGTWSGRMTDHDTRYAR